MALWSFCNYQAGSTDDTRAVKEAAKLSWDPSKAFWLDLSMSLTFRADTLMMTLLKKSQVNSVYAQMLRNTKHHNQLPSLLWLSPHKLAHVVKPRVIGPWITSKLHFPLTCNSSLSAEKREQCECWVSSTQMSLIKGQMLQTKARIPPKGCELVPVDSTKSLRKLHQIVDQ